ncbi:MAG: hypothetical protein ACREKH_20170 [Candidatus Rokuibacteriota bacterium]
MGRATWNGALSFSTVERLIRVGLATAAGVRELLLRDQAQPYVLLFVLAGLGLPEALRLLVAAIRDRS